MFGPPVKIDKKKSIYADFALLFCALVWGAQYAVTQDALDHLTPQFLNGMRFGISFIIMALVFPKRVAGFRLKDIIPGLVLGVSMFAAFSFHTLGLKYTMGGKAAFLTSVYVVIVPFFVWIQSKRFPGPDSLASSLLCLLGAGLLTGLGGSGLNKGDIFVLISAVFFAGNIMAVGYFAKRTDPIKMTLAETAVGAVLFLFTAFITEPAPAVIPVRTMFALGYIIVLGTIITHLLSNFALRHTLETHASIIFSVESVFALLVGIFFIKESFTPLMLSGCGLIFISLLVTELEPIKRWRGKQKEALTEAAPAPSAMPILPGGIANPIKSLEPDGNLDRMEKGNE